MSALVEIITAIYSMPQYDSKTLFFWQSLFWLSLGVRTKPQIGASNVLNESQACKDDFRYNLLAPIMTLFT